MINKERLVNEFIELASIDSVSLNERKMADRLREKLEGMGYEVLEDDAAMAIGGNTGNIICNIPGNKDDIPAIMLVAHIDTVTPGTNKKPIVDGDTIRTNGNTVLGGDDVAGVVCILEALRALKENKVAHGNIQVVFTVAEEVGLYGSKKLDFNVISSEYCFVLDGSGSAGTITIAAPFQDTVEISIMGKTAHAGIEPEKGVSAIAIAATAIASAGFGRIDNETTSNVGTIHGGTATNIVCDKVDLEIEVRSLSETKLEEHTARIVTCFEKAATQFGGQINAVVSRQFDGFYVDEDSAIINILRRACEKMFIDLKMKTDGGGSDANVISKHEINCVNLGVGMCNIHSVEEYILIDEMAESAEFVVNIANSVM